MKSTGLRLQKVQRLAHEIMYEVNLKQSEERTSATLKLIIDNLSRAVGDLADPLGNYSLDYLEDKIGQAHSLLFEKNEEKLKSTRKAL